MDEYEFTVLKLVSDPLDDDLEDQEFFAGRKVKATYSSGPTAEEIGEAFGEEGVYLFFQEGEWGQPQRVEVEKLVTYVQGTAAPL